MTRQITLFIMSLFFILTAIQSFAGVNKPYNQIIFFGDSLTDNGNLYRVDLKLFPKSPPYYQGQLSNGPTWADNIAVYFEKNDNIHSENYAVGGETAYLHNPFGGYLPYTLSSSVSNYLVRNVLQDKSHTLFVIWIGANDYLNGATDVDQTTSEVIKIIHDNMESLINHGAMHFLLLNLPDLSKTPYAQARHQSPNLLALTLAHNTKLDTAVLQMQNSHHDVNIALFDLYSLFNDLIDHPEIYNSKYHTNISNTNSACWPGGYTLRRKQTYPALIAKQLEKQWQSLSVETIHRRTQKTPDITALANYIAQSPDLTAAYEIAQSHDQGIAPCNNPETYVFWDQVHPTEAVHSILTNTMIDYIPVAFHF